MLLSQKTGALFFFSLLKGMRKALYLIINLGKQETLIKIIAKHLLKTWLLTLHLHYFFCRPILEAR